MQLVPQAQPGGLQEGPREDARPVRPAGGDRVSARELKPQPVQRNGLPEIPRYAWRARTYPWASATIAFTEAQHGPPVPVCLCGHPLTYSSNGARRCGACGRLPRAEET